MTHIGADEIDEAGISLVAQRMGIERGQAPVLPGRVENIRRRSDMRARDDEIRMRPGLRAGAVGADGEVAIDADRHAPGAGGLRGFRQLLIGDPLHPGEKIDPIPMLLREPRHGCRAGVLIFLGPIPPIWPVAILARRNIRAAPGSSRTARAPRPAGGENPRTPGSGRCRHRFEKHRTTRAGSAASNVRPPGSRPAAHRGNGRGRAGSRAHRSLRARVRPN